MMKSILIIILFLFLVAGCISSPVKTGNASQYEFPGLNNTTIFFLNLSSIQVIESVTDKSSVDILIEDNIGTFRYPVALDNSGNNARVNISIIPILGKNYARFNFSSNFSGFIAYTIPGSQDFAYLPVGNGAIRIVLPDNYTTGTIFPGYIQPVPDNITLDSKGREVLIWNNPSSERIRIKYYHRNTPVFLAYMFVFLLICAVIIWIYYYYSIAGLEKKRRMLEKGIKK